MAKTTIDIEIQTNVSGESVKDLRQQFNEVEDALFEMAGAGKQNTEEFRRLQREAAKIKERVDDLNESIDMLKPEAKFQAIANLGAGVASGFAAAQGAAQLFGQENEALDKSLAKVQAAMALAQGVQGLAGMGDSLKVVGNLLKSTTIGTKLATAAQWLYNAAMAANPIGLLIAGLAALVGVIALVVNAMEDENEAQKKIIASREKDIETLKRQKEALDNFQSFESNLAKARGATLEQTRQLEDKQHKEKIEQLRELKSKTIAQIDDISKLQLTSSGDELKELTEQKNKLIDEEQKYFNEILKLSNDYTIRESQRKTDDAKAEEERRKAAAAKSEERSKKSKEDAAQRQLDENQRLYDEWLESQRISDELHDQERAKEQERQKQLQNDFELSAKQNDEFSYKLYLEQKKRDEELLINKQKAKEQEVALTLQGLQSIQSLADAFAGKSEASQKKAFQIKKAASLAQATIETYQAAQSAFASQMAIPTPDAPIRANIAAAIAIASGLARVAVIAKTKFEGGGGGASGGGGGGNLGTFSQGGGGGQPPQGLTAQNTVTQLNPDGTVAGQGNREAAPMKAYVVESESRAVTERVNKLSNNSKIG
jgi:hypothetical protein